MLTSPGHAEVTLRPPPPPSQRNPKQWERLKTGRCSCCMGAKPQSRILGGVGSLEGGWESQLFLQESVAKGETTLRGHLRPQYLARVWARDCDGLA